MCALSICFWPRLVEWFRNQCLTHTYTCEYAMIATGICNSNIMIAVFIDNTQPEFKQSLYVAEIKEDTNVGDEILKVSAFDHDLETCVDKYNCPCGRVKYSINTGNENGLIDINPDSGVISLTRKLYGQYYPISLTILAKNEGELNTVEDNESDKALTTVIITGVQNNDDGGRKRRSLHHRTRRSVTVR